MIVNSSCRVSVQAARILYVCSLFVLPERQRRSRPVLRLLFSFVILATIGLGCDIHNSGGEDPLATEIVDAYAEPDTVQTGGTTRLSVIISDSLDSGFRYEWGGFRRRVYTFENHYEWTVDVQPGPYDLWVLVDRPGYTSVGKHFELLVVGRSSVAGDILLVQDEAGRRW